MQESKFGVVTACHAGDYFLAKATCASIRHFCGNIPICVVVDGMFTIDELIRTYDVVPLYVRDLPDTKMRNLCTGSGRSKLSAMWAGPFDYFLYLDSDAIFWGDVISEADWSAYDFTVLWKPCTEAAHESWLSHFYFDPKRLATFDPHFDWRWHPYFCSGAFAAKKNAIPFDVWCEAEEWREKDPQLFQLADQGLLNYLVFRQSAAGLLTYRTLDLQYISTMHPRNLVEQLLVTGFTQIPDVIPHPYIVHFCEQKPLLQNRQSYSRPFTAFRIAHYQQAYGKGISHWPLILYQSLQKKRC